MSAQHAQALIQDLCEVDERFTFGRHGPRVKAVSTFTPAARYAAACLKVLQGERETPPAPSSCRLSLTQADRLRAQVEREYKR